MVKFTAHQAHKAHQEAANSYGENGSPILISAQEAARLCEAHATSYSEFCGSESYENAQWFDSQRLDAWVVLEFLGY